MALKESNKSTENIIVRFAPSPTGWFHLGNARTALFNYLFAKNKGGKLILRIEDTDKERSKPEYEKDIVDNLDWLGIEFDETARQSDRLAAHKKYLEKLIKSGAAYFSKETPKEEGDREEVIRFRNPGKRVLFEDLIKGKISFDTTELGDFVIAKSINEPVFHLAVVVDDFEMGVTHVIRGEDHISNTPRQMLIQEAIGAPRLNYAHIPLILAPDRSKLSKRKHGESVSIKYYREHEYEPEALVNFLALLGWNPGTNEEIFSHKNLIDRFSMECVQKSGAIFNIEKLRWFNREYLKNKPWSKMAFAVLPATVTEGKTEKQTEAIWKVLLERFSTIGEIRSSLIDSGEFSFLDSRIEMPIEASKLIWKESDLGSTQKHLAAICSMIDGVDDNNFDRNSVKSVTWSYAEENGRGSVLWPMRFALSGKDKSPDPFTLAELLGKKETQRRLRVAVEKISGV